MAIKILSLVVKILGKIKSSLLRKIVLRIIQKLDDGDKSWYRILYKEYYGIEIGKYTYGFQQSSIAKGTKIGSFCSIAEGVKIGLMNHPLTLVSTHPFLYYKNRGFITKDSESQYADTREVVIENDVWLGTNCIIMPGVTVHNGAVIGAGAVVTKDVPPYEIGGVYRLSV